MPYLLHLPETNDTIAYPFSTRKDAEWIAKAIQNFEGVSVNVIYESQSSLHLALDNFGIGS